MRRVHLRMQFSHINGLLKDFHLWLQVFHFLRNGAGALQKYAGTVLDCHVRGDSIFLSLAQESPVFLETTANKLPTHNTS